ncbi:DUF3025 domain-containing protein [Cupriavidus plantarum]|uniref:DUF3025 family protein n=1 Tax=Cupriavidus plantarum TaxID=942865 RepID=A0A316FLH3_9BURK|nr:DUF3025 domain-containing protein [Cupriavidus plantarum]PWK38500.1 hypothetical protein C7419_1012398 [Cupriavidus plantarum]
MREDWRGIDWRRPWFRLFAEIGAAIGHGVDAEGPLHATLNRRVAGLRNARGLPLRFVPQDRLPVDTAYESHIFATGEVPTRDNLHDAFNALVWRHFPETKQWLNRLQAEEIARAGISNADGGRGSARDAATLFDENAVIFLYEDATLEAALRDFQWRTLFVDARARWGTDCAVVPFGHALLEKLVTPYKSVTAHAWPLRLPVNSPLEAIDHALAASLEAARDTLRGRSFAPLPVMGVPGWCADNADPAYYDDRSVFRPGRRR